MIVDATHQAEEGILVYELGDEDRLITSQTLSPILAQSKDLSIEIPHLDETECKGYSQPEWSTSPQSYRDEVFERP